MIQRSPVTELVYNPVINFALQQNHVPVVRKLVLRNSTAADWLDLKVSISLEPDIAHPWQYTIPVLPAGGIIELDTINIRIKAQVLAELTEGISGCLNVQAGTTTGIGFEEQYPISILAYDQWPGIGVLPGMLSAFVTPNHPDIPLLLRQASVILERWTGNPSLDAYQSGNPDRVRKQMAAIYEAIAARQLLYCTAPASFEEQGQRIRLADSVLGLKMGNCLDMALLYASCLEAAGINALLIITKGHAFSGAWLIDETFADPVNDDPSLLTKRLAAGINEITLVEATCMNAAKNTSFDEAVRIAGGHLQQHNSFELFVDVKRARFSHIRPLPLRMATAGGFTLTEDSPTAERVSGAPLTLDETLAVTDGGPAAAGRQQLWERKLLDLSLRNNLLNLRINKGSLQLISIDVARLEDALAGGEEFQILPRPEDWDNPIRDAGLYRSLYTSDPITELARHELSQKRLRCYHNAADLDNDITTLYRASRLAIEENGASTLYMAIGFLKWYETTASEVARYAPILLVPVELIRKSARQGFVLRSREEEPMLNVTLLEKLRQDYGISISGLEVLPRDQQGIDVAALFNVLRRAVMTQARWDIEEQAVLGTFSFSKFILWHDIHNNSEHLRRNKVVASLLSNQLQWQVLPETERQTDLSIQPSDIALPIATDSAQLEAIISSTEGKSFVLHGPPGTGKSQTITNMIAAALYAGKKVLFVAAKKAALDVVESRLEQIGIADFCLELHANKAKKTAVIEQLKRATEVVKKNAPPAFAAEARRLSALRNELNLYNQAIHYQWPCGLSLYDAFTRYHALGQDKAAFSLPQAIIAPLTATRITDWEDIVSELAVIARVIGQPATHPLRGLVTRAYSPQRKEEINSALLKYMSVLEQAGSKLERTATLLGIVASPLSREQSAVLLQLSKNILALPDLPASLIAPPAAEQLYLRLKELAAHGRKRDELLAGLLQQFDKGLLGIAADRLLQSWRMAGTKWFLPRLLAQRKVINALRPFSRNGVVRKAEVDRILESVLACNEEQAILDQSREERAAAGMLWRDEATDWTLIEQACDALTTCFNSAAMLLGPAACQDWRLRFAAATGTHTALFLHTHRQELEQLEPVMAELERTELLLTALAGRATTASEGSNWIQDNGNSARRQQQAISDLKDWTSWTQIRDKAVASGLDSLVAAYETGLLTAATMPYQFRKALYQGIATYIIDQTPLLAGFNSALFEDKIERFKQISQEFERLTREELYATLAARIPDFSIEAAQSSEVGILQKAIRSNSRGMSIRRLFDAVPNLLQRLSPCMLMSPISVAQYFDAAQAHFDLVIFDEASQLPTCEAVSAMARGTHVVIVGDPKQMPPTSFFTSNNREEDNPEEDLESILDDCLALSMPSRHLRWHYRSKHESLIAFSNATYYEHKLLTFPSTDDLVTKVSLVRVAGHYDKGKTRQNRAEAVAVVAAILHRLADPVLSTYSMGVVTFSSVQQHLIEDLLTEAFRKAPQLEKVAMDATEPLFIKNLENVQGDERDLILFSVCYGPDEQGKVSLNFGPLNRDGGWRRLNVAVSRARYEMLVFSTLLADDINLARSGSEGVAGLKAFLAFAEKGKQALPVKASQAPAAQPAGLEATIAAAIRSRGYEVHQSIGCSDYRVDIGIVHPERPSEYLLGILCDGHNHKVAKTARDRMIVQESVLRSLGWSLHRVWSPDWWEHPATVLDRIQLAIDKALNAKQQVSGSPIAKAVPPAPPGQAPDRLLNNTIPASGLGTRNTHSYERCLLPLVQDAAAEGILQSRHRKRLQEQISQVLDKESPISRPLLYRRLLAAWGISRSGARISAYLDELIGALGIRQVQHGDQVFLWKQGQQPEAYKMYRLHKEDWKRDAEDLPPEETAMAIHAILKAQLSLSKNDLLRESARLFGYTRMGTKVDEAMQRGIDLVLARGLAGISGERIVYKANI